MLRIRKVSTELTPLVEWVLKRDEFRYTLQDMGGYTEFRIEDISSRRFNDVIEDAKCEKERRESLTPEIPVLSYRALMNPEREARLLRLYGADCCMPYSKHRLTMVNTPLCKALGVKNQIFHSKEIQSPVA